MKNKNQCLLPVFMTAIVLLFCSAQLWAQSSDTLFVIEEEFVYDTLFVHDTLHIYDTITIDEYIHSPEFEQLFYNSEFIDSQTFPDSLKKIFTETVTFWENNVFDSKQEKFSSMDSIKKFGLTSLIVLGLCSITPAQKEDKIIQHQDTMCYEKGDFSQKNYDINCYSTDSTNFYKYSVGLCITSLGGGPSIKYGVSKNCVFQTDFTGRFFINKYTKEESFLLYVFDVSQSFLFQRMFAEKKGVIYYYMFGGGVSGGVSMLRPHLWKIGTYPFFGMEFVLKKPKLSFQIDIRAGYCSLLKSINAKPPHTDLTNNPLWLFCYTGVPKEFPYHGYDISVNFAVRFCKIK